MKKIIVTVISIVLLTNVRGAADGPGGLENVSIVQPAAAVDSVDSLDRLSCLERKMKDLLTVNRNLWDRVAAVEAQNMELHGRLQATEAWIDAERKRKASLAAHLQALNRSPQSQSGHHALGEMREASGWNGARSAK